MKNNTKFMVARLDALYNMMTSMDINLRKTQMKEQENLEQLIVMLAKINQDKSLTEGGE
jgi:hypothetical protein